MLQDNCLLIVAPIDGMFGKNEWFMKVVFMSLPAQKQENYRVRI